MRALVVDFGGVLTTSIWPAFASFCEGEGLEPETVRELFRGDAEALALLRGLETGALADAEFEAALRRHARRRRPRGPDHAGCSPASRPDEAMIDAVRAAARARACAPA